MTDTDETKAKPQRKGRRAEKSELTRNRLFEAAVRLVGDLGYAGSTIRKITSHARIAHGTFYNYFDSQQDIFDQLLPYMGERLRQYLDQRLDETMSFIERQDVLLVGFDDFIQENPAFYRVLTEAEIFAPKGYRVYVAETVAWFLHHFSEDRNRGAYNAIRDQQLEVIAFILMGSQHYLNMRFNNWMGEVTRMPSWAVETFHDFVRGGMLRVNGGDGGRPAAISGSKPETVAVTGNGAAPAPSTTETPPTEIVKFTPRPGEAEPFYSAQSTQIGCRTIPQAPGHVVVELDIDRRTLNSRGAVSGGTLSALMEIAGAAAMRHKAHQISAETIGISCTVIRAATEGVLHADSRVENAGRNIRFVTVRVTLDNADGPLIAHGSVTYRVIE
jgi:uncharacterized protein (TIGR00369 family)